MFLCVHTSLIYPQKTKHMRLDTILNIVSIETGIHVDNLKTKSRKVEIVMARNIYFKFARHFTNYSNRVIGLEVNRDHATVLHGIKSLIKDLETDYLECNKLVSTIYKQLVNKSKDSDILRDVSSLVIKETNLFNLIYQKLYNHYLTIN